MKIKSWKATGALSLMAKDCRLQSRIVWFGTSDTFNAVALMEAVYCIQKNQPSVYWHYNESLSDEQVEKIWEDGYEGLNEIENEIYDSNFEEDCRLRDECFKSNFWDELNVKSFTSDYLSKIREEHSDGEDSDEDLVDFIKDEYEDELEEEAREFLKDYVEVDWDWEQLYKNTGSQQVEIRFSLSEYIPPSVMHLEEWYEDEVCAYSSELSIEELAGLAEKMKENKALAIVDLELVESGWKTYMKLGGKVCVNLDNATCSVESYSSSTRDLISFEIAESFEINKEGKYFVSEDGDAYVESGTSPLHELLRRINTDKERFHKLEMSSDVAFTPFVMKDENNKHFTIIEYEGFEQEALCFFDGEWLNCQLTGDKLSSFLDEFDSTTVSFVDDYYIYPDGTSSKEPFLPF